MLSPDITDLLTDPDIGGGVPFTVLRKTYTRILGGTAKFTEVRTACEGNIQNGQPKVIRQQSTEDQTDESIVIRSTFPFQTGSDQESSFTAADEVLAWGRVWRVTHVEDWTQWGFTTAYATLRRMKGDDAVVVDQDR